MKYDVHTHAFHPKIAHKVLCQLAGHYGICPLANGIAEDLIFRIREAGLDRAVVHTAATTPEQVVPANNWARQLMCDHDEIIAFGTIHPGYAHWEQALDKLEEAGVPGLKIHPDFQGFRLDDPALYPILEAASGRFTVMVHVGDKLPPKENPSCPYKMAALRDRFPDLTFIAAHFGGWQHWEYARETLIGTDIYIDTSSSLPFLDDESLADIFNRHPRERILFGSDYPLWDPATEASRLQERLRLTDQELETLQTNASVLFE